MFDSDILLWYDDNHQAIEACRPKLFRAGAFVSAFVSSQLGD